MPRYSVATDQTAFYARVVNVPRSRAKDRAVAGDIAIAEARDMALPLPGTDDPLNPWDIGGYEVATRFEGETVVEGADGFDVTVGVKLWVTRSIDVDAPDGDAACEAAWQRAVDPHWPQDDGGWRLTCVEAMTTCDPETDEEENLATADDDMDDEDDVPSRSL